MPPPRVTERAPAKVNLTLHVTGRREDGYHLLDSLVAFATTWDRVTVAPAPVSALRVTGPRAAGVPEGPENLVLRAAALMGVTVEITLEKHLPAAAGIGGGSSDAAATLRALSRLTGRAPPGALVLGADLPVCLLGRAARLGQQVHQRSDRALVGYNRLAVRALRLRRPSPALPRAAPHLY